MPEILPIHEQKLDGAVRRAISSGACGGITTPGVGLGEEMREVGCAGPELDKDDAGGRRSEGGDAGREEAGALQCGLGQQAENVRV